MDDLASKLSEIINNPESFDRLKSLSGLFGQDLKPVEEKTKESKLKKTVPEQSIMSNDMMKKVMKIMPLLSSINKDDASTKFLLALKPLLSESRRKRIDESIKMLHMMKIMPILKSQEIF